MCAAHLRQDITLCVPRSVACTQTNVCARRAYAVAHRAWRAKLAQYKTQLWSFLLVILLPASMLVTAVYTLGLLSGPWTIDTSAWAAVICNCVHAIGCMHALSTCLAVGPCVGVACCSCHTQAAKWS